MSQHRADPFAIDVAAFTPSRAAKLPKDAIKALSEAANFPSRSPQLQAEPQRRRRTGRNVQLNIKATADTIARFTALSDARGWAFGETLEHAVTALERDLRN